MTHLLRERWIVGEYADRIVVQVQSVGHRLYDHCAGTIRDYPVQLGARHCGVKERIGELQVLQFFFCLCQIGTLTQ